MCRDSSVTFALCRPCTMSKWTMLTVPASPSRGILAASHGSSSAAMAANWSGLSARYCSSCRRCHARACFVAEDVRAELPNRLRSQRLVELVHAPPRRLQRTPRHVVAAGHEAGRTLLERRVLRVVEQHREPRPVHAPQAVNGIVRMVVAVLVQRLGRIQEVEVVVAVEVEVVAGARGSTPAPRAPPARRASATVRVHKAAGCCAPAGRPLRGRRGRPTCGRGSRARAPRRA